MSGNEAIVEIDYEPQSYQASIHESQARFRVVVIGRRGGKSVMSINDLIVRAIETPGLYWLIAPSYKQAKAIGWNLLKKFLRPDPLWKFNEVELRATHVERNTTIELKGADNEDSLRGVGLNGCVIDECAFMKPNVWPEIIRPMLADSNGWALFIGTPKGKDWFFDLYSTKSSLHESWHYPTMVNEFISKEELDQMKRDMPERLYRQEILAEFLDDSVGVFRNIRPCVVGELQPPVLGRFYLMGVDLGKSLDFTVLTVIDSVTRQVVAFERFQDLSWVEQKERIQQLASTYNNAKVIIDSTGVGDAIYDDLLNVNISIEPFKFTNESKKKLIEKLAVAIEQRLITFPNLEVLIDELRQFDYELTAEGRIKYGAPEGKHDDCVISLALANWGIRHELYASRVVQERQLETDPVDRVGRGTPAYEYEHQPNFSGY